MASAIKIANNLEKVDAEYIFEDTRMLFGYMPVKLEVDNIYEKEEQIAYIRRMLVRVDSEHVQRGGDDFLRSILMHEFRHLSCEGAPETLVKGVMLAKAVKPLLKDKEFVAVPSLLNIVYDVLGDTVNEREFGPDSQFGYDLHALAHQMSTIYKGFEKEKEEDFSDPKKAIKAYLLAYPEEIVGNRFTGLTFPDEVREAARKSVDICRDFSLDLKEQVVQMVKLVLPLFVPPDKQQGGGKGKGGPPSKEQLEEMAQAIKDALKERGRSETLAAGKDGLKDDPLAQAIGQLDPNDEEEMTIVGQMLGISTKDIGFAKLKAKAKREIRFNVTGNVEGPSSRTKVGTQEWQSHMNLRDLDVVESFLHGGPKLIPGVTTRRNLVHNSPSSPGEGSFPRIAVSIDTSGSMTGGNRKETTLVALFAMIEEAKKRGVPILVDMWADYHATFDWSCRYDDVMKKTYDKIDSTGGGNSLPGTDQLRGRLRKGDLLIYVTDFHLGSHCSIASRDLRQFVNDGIQTIILGMFSGNSAGSIGLPYVDVVSLEGLSGAMLEAIPKK